MFRTLAFTLFVTACTTAIAHAEPVCVLAKNAQLRKGPATTFPVTWAVGQYMPFMKLTEKNGWAEVKDLDGQTHWVIAKALTSKFGCSVVKAREVHLHSGPSNRAAATEPELAERYQPFKRVKREGDWVKLQDDHKSEFWIPEASLWTPGAKSSQ